MFSKEDTQMANTCMKMVNSTYHKEMQIQPQDIALYLSEWLSSRRQEKAVVDKEAEKRELLCLVGRNVNWCSHDG